MESKYDIINLLSLKEFFMVTKVRNKNEINKIDLRINQFPFIILSKNKSGEVLHPIT